MVALARSAHSQLLMELPLDETLGRQRSFRPTSPDVRIGVQHAWPASNAGSRGAFQHLEMRTSL
jgi:hypothetical protein